MCRRYDINSVISAAIYIDVHHCRRLHDGLHGGRFFEMQYPSAGDVDVLERWLDATDGLVSNDVVNAVLVEMMLELAVSDTYPAPVVVLVVQIPLAAMQEDEPSLPRTFVTMTKQLTVQSDLAILEALLFPRTL